MHSEYLRQLFLNNDLSEGRFRIEGRPVSISDIHVPIFSVATTRDHIAPWRSVYKVHGLAETDITFLLTNGGHNAGIVSEPGHKGRHYRLRATAAGNEFVDPNNWYSETEQHEGSWWLAWRDWIVNSVNADKGYDRMIQEMLAGDELDPGNRDVVAGTGFLARNYYLFNRTTWLDNTIEHSGKAFLGLTLNCAKCHDHKYDPVSQVDYYSYRAFFEPHQIRLDAVPGESDFEKDGLASDYLS